jgi:tetratricopeptide (TPR) repeat protein
VRITAQLIDTKDSSHLWSQTFDRDYDAENLFNIQSEIARSITDRLRMTLTGEDKARLVKVPTKNTEAYAAYLLGRDRLRDRKVDGLKDAVEQFARAIELDPEFAAAYSGLADACYIYGDYSGGQGHEHCPTLAAEYEQLARKALELDPECGEAWITLAAAIKLQTDGSLLESAPKFHEIIAAYERGLELNPALSQGYHWLGIAHQFFVVYPDPPRGWFEAWRAGVWESIYDKGLEVDPLSIPLHHMKTRYPLVVKSKEEAIWHGHRLVEIAPDSPRGYEALGEQAWGLSGRLDESIRWESQALERDPKHPTFPTSIGAAYSALGDPDMALAYFDLAKALTAPDNESDQRRLLVEQAVIRLVSGNVDAHQDAEVNALLSESNGYWGLGYGVFIDLATGKPADALARVDAITPKCLGAKSIPKDNIFGMCPIELVRVYQELGDDATAQALGDANVQGAKMWADGWPENNNHLDYARALATAGRTDDALDVLENLVSSGWRGEYSFFLRFVLYFDVTFDAVRDDARFQAIVTTIEADMAQQLENVREMQQRGEVLTLEQVNARVASLRKGG